jgi:hypothetical protein
MKDDRSSAAVVTAVAALDAEIEVEDRRVPSDFEDAQVMDRYVLHDTLGVLEEEALAAGAVFAETGESVAASVS